MTHFVLAGFGAFSGINPGTMVDPSVTFDSNQAFGSYTDTILLNATSTNASGSTNLAPVPLNIQAQVVPEPGAGALILLGGAMLFARQRLLRRKSNCPPTV